MPLVTNLSGTQTFGWSDGHAMFPSQAPTLTTPPFAELTFPLYLKPKSEAYVDVVEAVIRSLGQPPTPLNTAFFARDNVDLLQRAIQSRIAETMGIDIERQSDWQLLLIMRRTYMETANNWPEDVTTEVSRLNTMVLQDSTVAVSQNVAAFMTYQSKLPMPVPLPDPAERLTFPPFETGVPAPLRNLNEEYERGIQGYATTRSPQMYTSVGQTPAPSVSPTTPSTQPPNFTLLWSTAPPRETNATTVGSV